MQQLLPEVRSIFDKLGGGEEIYLESIPINKEWEHFISFVNEIDAKIEEEKIIFISKVPSHIKKPLSDALYKKRNNDRALNGYVAAFSVGGKPENFINVFLALEVLDSSVIIVDDLLDNAERRANQPAYHKKWGEDMTMIIAMLLKSSSSQIILESELNEEIKLKLLHEIESLHSKIYEGQLLDVEYEKKAIHEISEEDYLNMISLTTGYQISSGLRIGGMLSNTDSSTISILGEIGLRLGILGQIRDDLVDYLFDEKNIWKTPLLDFKRNKKRIPLLIGWKNATSEERIKIMKLQKINEFDKGDYTTILSILMKPQNIQRIRAMMAQMREEGYKMIENGNFTYEGKRLLHAYFSYGMGET